MTILFTKLCSFLVSNPKAKFITIVIIVGLFLSLIAFVTWQTFSLSNVQAELKLEQVRHLATTKERDAALAEILEYQAVLKDAELKIKGQQDLGLACLEREQNAQTNKRERDDIINNAKPTQRTEAEKKELADEPTRKRAIDRLNRPL